MTPDIHCPGCGQPLHVPASALGQLASCPHCSVSFRVPANPDGTPGTPELVRRRFNVPRTVAGPGIALLLVGLLGASVNGSRLLMFLTKPGSDLAYAREQVQLIRDQETLQAAKDKKPEEKPDPAQDARNEELAEAWAPAMKPIHAIFLVCSLFVTAGGSCFLAGRFYPLAFIGCLAAMANLNNFCCVPGGIAGVWGMLILIRDDTRRYFGLS